MYFSASTHRHCELSPSPLHCICYKITQAAPAHFPTLSFSTIVLAAYPFFSAAHVNLFEEMMLTELRPQLVFSYRNKEILLCHTLDTYRSIQVRAEALWSTLMTPTKPNGNKKWTQRHQTNLHMLWLQLRPTTSPDTSEKNVPTLPFLLSSPLSFLSSPLSHWESLTMSKENQGACEHPFRSQQKDDRLRPGRQTLTGTIHLSWFTHKNTGAARKREAYLQRDGFSVWQLLIRPANNL